MVDNAKESFVLGGGGELPCYFIDSVLEIGERDLWDGSFKVFGGRHFVECS